MCACVCVHVPRCARVHACVCVCLHVLMVELAGERAAAPDWAADEEEGGGPEGAGDDGGMEGAGGRGADQGRGAGGGWAASAAWRRRAEGLGLGGRREREEGLGHGGDAVTAAGLDGVWGVGGAAAVGELAPDRAGRMGGWGGGGGGRQAVSTWEGRRCRRRRRHPLRVSEPAAGRRWRRRSRRVSAARPRLARPRVSDPPAVTCWSRPRAPTAVTSSEPHARLLLQAFRQHQVGLRSVRSLSRPAAPLPGPAPPPRPCAASESARRRQLARVSSAARPRHSGLALVRAAVHVRPCFRRIRSARRLPLARSALP